MRDCESVARATLCPPWPAAYKWARGLFLFRGADAVESVWTSLLYIVYIHLQKCKLDIIYHFYNAERSTIIQCHCEISQAFKRKVNILNHKICRLHDGITISLLIIYSSTLYCS